MFARAKNWSELNRDIWLDVVRIALGLALFLKGAAVLRAAALLEADLETRGLPIDSSVLVHYAAVTHFIGGTMLVFGVGTRLAAVVQMPNVLGAIFFIHAGSGLFSADQGLEVATLVLVMLVTFACTGAGRLSTDWYFSEHPHEMSAESAELAKLSVSTAKFAALDAAVDIDQERERELDAAAREAADLERKDEERITLVNAKTWLPDVHEHDDPR